MFDFLKWRLIKRDAAPGSLIYAGRSQDFTPSLCSIRYSPAGYDEACPDISGTRPAHETGCTVLYRVEGIHDAEMVQRMGEWFDLPPLALEDVMNSGQQPKLEWLDDETVFMVLKDMDFNAEAMKVRQEQVCIFWRADTVVLFQERPSQRFEPVMERIRKGRRRIREGGAGYLAIALLDAVIERSFSTLGAMSAEAERMELQLEENPTEHLLTTVYRLRREAAILGNTLLPVHDMLRELSREEDSFSTAAQPYLRDVKDHSDQAARSVEAMQTILQGMIELQISMAGMKTNRIMQILTLVATIFIPLTFIAGVYGMNFEYMPELGWKYGYFTCLGLMTGIGLLMAWLFVRKKWL